MILCSYTRPDKNAADGGARIHRPDDWHEAERPTAPTIVNDASGAMRVLVTGAAGFVGTHLCRELLDRGHQVVAGLHERALPPDLAGRDGLRGQVMDLLDPSACERLVSDAAPDAVCHLAVSPPDSVDAATSYAVNVSGTDALLGACARFGVGRLVFTSSMSVYPFAAPEYLPVDEQHPVLPQQAYGLEKWHAEKLCHQHGGDGLCVPILRLAGVYGPGKARGAVHAFARTILDGQTVRIPADRRIDLLYCADAAAAIANSAERAAELGTCTLNIGAGRSVSLADLAAVIGHQLGREPALEVEAAGGEFYMDIERARDRLDFAPRSLDQGIAGVLESMGVSHAAA